MSSKLVDEEFKFIGKKPELIIWRIENFKLIRIPPNNYGLFNFKILFFSFSLIKNKNFLGTFYTGDSYLVFNVKIFLFYFYLILI